MSQKNEVELDSEIFTQQIVSDEEEKISLISPTSPDEQASQAFLTDSADDSKPSRPKKRSGLIWNDDIAGETAECTHMGRCGIHEHFDDEEKFSCSNIPWGKTTLLEHDMSRKSLMVKRYVKCFEANYLFTLHFVLFAFKDAKISILEPVQDSLPFPLIMTLLNSPKNFSFRCMTVCDMELLRVTILKYFGVHGCGCDERFLGITVSDFEGRMNPALKADIEEDVTTAKTKILKTYFKNVQILCDECHIEKKVKLHY